MKAEKFGERRTWQLDHDSDFAMLFNTPSQRLWAASTKELGLNAYSPPTV